MPVTSNSGISDTAEQAAAGVVLAAFRWVDGIVDPPNQWADEDDFALIAAVQNLRTMLSLNRDSG